MCEHFVMCCRVDRKRRIRANTTGAVSTKRHPPAKNFGQKPPKSAKVEGEEEEDINVEASPKKGPGKKSSKMPKLKKETLKITGTSDTTAEMPLLEVGKPQLKITGDLSTEPSKQIMGQYLRGPHIGLAEEQVKSDTKSFEAAFYEHFATTYQQPIEEVVKLRRNAKKEGLKCIPGLSSAPSTSTDPGSGGLVPGAHLQTAQVYTLTNQSGPEAGSSTTGTQQQSDGGSGQQQSAAGGTSQQQSQSDNNAAPSDNSTVQADASEVATSVELSQVEVGAPLDSSMLASGDSALPADIMMPDIKEDPSGSSTIPSATMDPEIKPEGGDSLEDAGSAPPTLQPEMLVSLHEECRDEVQELQKTDDGLTLGEPPAKIPKVDVSSSGRVPEPVPDIAIEMPIQTSTETSMISVADLMSTSALAGNSYPSLVETSTASTNTMQVANGLAGMFTTGNQSGNNTFVRSVTSQSKDAGSKVTGIRKMPMSGPQLQVVGGQPQFLLQGVTQIHPAIDHTSLVKQTKQATVRQQKMASSTKPAAVYQQIIMSPKVQQPVMKPYAIVQSPATTQTGVLNLSKPKSTTGVTLKPVGAPKSANRNGVSTVLQIPAPNTSRKLTVREELAKVMTEKVTTSSSQEASAVSQATQAEQIVLTSLPSAAQTVVVPSTSTTAGTGTMIVASPKVMGQTNKPIFVSQASIAPTTSILQNVAVGQKMVTSHVQANSQQLGNPLARAVSPGSTVTSPKGVSRQAAILVSGSNYKIVDAASLMTANPNIQLGNIQGQLKAPTAVQPKLVVGPTVSGLGASQTRSLLVTSPSAVQAPAIRAQSKPLSPQGVKRQQATGPVVSIAGLSAGMTPSLQWINNQLVLTTTPQSTTSQAQLLQQQLLQRQVQQVIVPKTESKCADVLRSPIAQVSRTVTEVPCGSATRLPKQQQSKNFCGVVVTKDGVQAQPLSTPLSLHTMAPIIQQHLPTQVVKTEPQLLLQPNPSLLTQVMKAEPQLLLHPSPSPSPSTLMASQLQTDSQVVQTLTTVKQDPFLGPTETVSTLGENCTLTAETSSETTSDGEHLAEAVVTETVTTSVDMSGEYTVSTESPLYIAEQPDIAVDHSYQQSYSDSELAKELLKKPKKKTSTDPDSAKKKVSLHVHLI